jgi:integrase
LGERDGISSGTVDTLVTSLFTTMNTLDELRILEQNNRLDLPNDRDFVGRWNKQDFPARPDGTDLNATPANTNRDAMSLRLIRLALLILCTQIETLKTTAAGRRRLFQPLRDRALIATLAITGLRRGAFNRLWVGDVVRDFVFPDNEHGPALVPRPGKTLGEELKRPKGIPDVLFDWLWEYVEYAGVADEPDAPLWLPHNAKRRLRRESLGDTQITNIVKARFEVKSRRPGQRPETRPLYIAFAEEHDGRSYSPHQLRHAAEKIAFTVGLDWLEENRTRLLQHGSGLPANPQVFPDALLDHAMQTMGDRYKDVASERGRLKWARKCALGVAEYVVGAKGARLGPDLDLIRHKQSILEHAEARRAETDRELEALEVRIISSGEGLDLKSIMLANVQMGRLARQLAAVTGASERARHELAEALKAEVPVPEYWTNRDLAAQKDNPTGREEETPEGDEEVQPIREWASLEEFHWALGGQDVVSIETVRRWVRGERTRFAIMLGLPESQDGKIPSCVQRISARKQRIALNLIDWSRLPVPVQENLEAIRHTTGVASLSGLLAS